MIISIYHIIKTFILFGKNKNLYFIILNLKLRIYLKYINTINMLEAIAFKLL